MDDAVPINDTPDVHKLKLVARANQLFHCLRQAGSQRDAAGNRDFLYSHYAALVLLGLFNPALYSLRGLHEASALKRVQKKLGIGRVSLGSFSESCRVFDPALLVPIVEGLLADFPAHHPGPGPRRHIPETIPHELARKLVVADGSALRALPQIVRAVGRGDWKLHLQFRPLSGLPNVPVLARENDAGERDVLAQKLEPGCVYIADRGYERYALYNQIVNAGSDYVIRGQRRTLAVVASHPVSDAARTARVVTDDTVVLRPNQPGQPRSSRTDALTHAIRRIVIAKRHQGRPRPDRRDDTEVVLYTNRLDLPAEVVAAIYELRWSIELFFRFLKQVLGCRKLFSDKPEAAAIQLYCALIAGLLLARVTGGRVTATVFRLMCLYLQGWADDNEVLAALTRAREKEP